MSSVNRKWKNNVGLRQEARTRRGERLYFQTCSMNIPASPPPSHDHRLLYVKTSRAQRSSRVIEIGCECPPRLPPPGGPPQGRDARRRCEWGRLWSIGHDGGRKKEEEKNRGWGYTKVLLTLLPGSFLAEVVADTPSHAGMDRMSGDGLPRASGE